MQNFAWQLLGVCVHAADKPAQVRGPWAGVHIQMDPGGGRGGRSGSPPPDEPPPKRQAVDDYGHMLGGATLGPEGRWQLKENLQKRKRCLEDELRFLNNAGGLLDFAGSLSKTGTGSFPTHCMMEKSGFVLPRAVCSSNFRPSRWHHCQTKSLACFPGGGEEFSHAALCTALYTRPKVHTMTYVCPVLSTFRQNLQETTEHSCTENPRFVTDAGYFRILSGHHVRTWERISTGYPSLNIPQKKNGMRFWRRDPEYFALETGILIPTLHHPQSHL